MINLVELAADEEDTEQAPCCWGNVVVGHACYCHAPDSPYRKCPQFRSGEPYEECEFFELYEVKDEQH